MTAMKVISTPSYVGADRRTPNGSGITSWLVGILTAIVLMFMGTWIGSIQAQAQQSMQKVAALEAGQTAVVSRLDRIETKLDRALARRIG